MCAFGAITQITKLTRAVHNTLCICARRKYDIDEVNTAGKMCAPGSNQLRSARARAPQTLALLRKERDPPARHRLSLSLFGRNSGRRRVRAREKQKYDQENTNILPLKTLHHQTTGEGPGRARAGPTQARARMNESKFEIITLAWTPKGERRARSQSLPLMNIDSGVSFTRARRGIMNVGKGEMAGTARAASGMDNRARVQDEKVLGFVGVLIK